MRVKLNLNEFISKVRTALLKGSVKDAMGVCEQNRSPVASIVKSGLLKFADGKPRDVRYCRSSILRVCAASPALRR